MALTERKNSREKDEKFGLSRMTKESILKLCKKNKLYVTPHLNDVLYLHYQGYQQIGGLEEYTGLKCLWLESNAISEISGLETQTQLRCLFMHNNLLKKIANLEHCPRLDTVNFANNFITTIENCDSKLLPELTTLNLAHNKIKSLCDFELLVQCGNLSVLDLSHNRIDDILIVGVLGKMPELRVLMMMGNPVVNMIPMYRKTLINECKQLTYLDTRPVFDRDRACAVAWKRGGYEEEKKEHSRWNRAERKKVRDGVNATLALRIQKSIEKGEEPTVELLVSSSDDDDDILAITGGSGDFMQNKTEFVTRRERKIREFCDESGDGIYNEINDSDKEKQQIYDDYCNNIELNLVLENEMNIDKNGEVKDVNEGSEIVLKEMDPSEIFTLPESTMDYECISDLQHASETQPTDSATQNSEESSNEVEVENVIDRYYENIPEVMVKHNHLPVEKCMPEVFENISDTETIRIQSKRKMIIQQILQRPSLPASTDDDVQEVNFVSDLITYISADASEHANLSTNEISTIENQNEEVRMLSRSEPFQEHVNKLVEQHRNNFPIVSDTESETDYKDYDDIDSVVADASATPTTSIRGFLKDYNEFIDSMQTKHDNQKTAEGELDQDNIGVSISDDQDEQEIPDLDVIHKGIFDFVLEDHDSKQSSIERMLQCRDPIFDIPPDILNVEVDALRTNANNNLVEMMNRVFLKKEQYYNPDDTSVNCNIVDRDAEPVSTDWIKNYYSDFCGLKKSSGKTTSDPLEQLKAADDGTERISTVRFYCEDLTKVVADEVVQGDHMVDQNDCQLNSIEEVITDEVDNAIQIQSTTSEEESNESADRHNYEDLKYIENSVLNVKVDDSFVVGNSALTDEQQLQLVEEMSQLQYMQSLIYSAPKLSDIVLDEPYFEEGEFGLTAEQAALATSELRESPEFQKRMQSLANLDHQLDQGIRSCMLDASIEFGLLNELQNTSDPNDDNETDIVSRVEKYASEFKDRVKECKKLNNL